MSLKFLRSILFGFFSLVLLLPFDSLAQTLPDQVAKIGNVTVSKYDLRREIQRILPMNVGFHSGVSQEKADEIQQKALQGLIDQSLKVQYAITQEISVANSVVEERLQKVRDKFKSDAEFKQALGGETVEAFRASVYRIILAKHVEKVTVDEKAKVSDESIRQHNQCQEVIVQVEICQANKCTGNDVPHQADLHHRH